MNRNAVKSRVPAPLCSGLISEGSLHGLGTEKFGFTAARTLCYKSSLSKWQKDVGRLRRSPHSPRPFVFHFLWFYYSSSVLEEAQASHLSLISL